MVIHIIDTFFYHMMCLPFTPRKEKKVVSLTGPVSRGPLKVHALVSSNMAGKCPFWMGVLVERSSMFYLHLRVIYHQWFLLASNDEVL